MKKENQIIDLENKRIEKKFASRMTAMLCSTILGILGLIGAFWGNTGLEIFGLVVLLIAFVTIWISDSTI